MIAKLQKKKGFTLGEMITTVAIIGTLAAITVPNYIRYRADTNAELVRQHLRIIAEKMVEILGKEGLFPRAEDWSDWAAGNPTSADEDILAITASLSAIDDYCYTNTNYMVPTERSSYRFCSGPRYGDACGKQAGGRRFCIHYDSQMSALFAPGVAGEVAAWEPLSYNFDGINMAAVGITQPSLDTIWLVGQLGHVPSAYGYFENLLGPLDLQRAATIYGQTPGVDFYAGMYEAVAYFLDGQKTMLSDSLPHDPAIIGSNQQFTRTIAIPDSLFANYNANLQSINDYLMGQGIAMQHKTLTDSEKSQYWSSVYFDDLYGNYTGTPPASRNYHLVEVSFQLEDRINTFSESEMRCGGSSLCSAMSATPELLTVTTSTPPQFDYPYGYPPPEI